MRALAHSEASVSARSAAPGGAGGDHQPLLHEPLAGQVIAAADRAEHLLGTDRDLVEEELGVLEDERVHVGGGPLDDTPGRFLSTRNSVGARSEPTSACTMRKSATSPTVTNHFSPADPVAVAVALGHRLDERRVRARLLLGDGEAVAAVAVDGGDQVALALGRRAVAQGVGRTPDGVPQRVGELTQPLLDDHLLEHGQPLAAPLDGHVDGVELVLEGETADLGQRRVGQPAALLAGLLEGDHGLGQPLRAVAQLLLLRGVGELHGLAPVTWG